MFGFAVLARVGVRDVNCVLCLLFYDVLLLQPVSAREVVLIFHGC